MRYMVILGIIASLFGCSTSKGAHFTENDTIVYFYYSKSGGMRAHSGFSYLIKETDEGRVQFLFDERLPKEKVFTIDDHAVFDSLQKIVLKHQMYKYSGNYQPTMQVTDGYSWDFRVKYASGKEISARGYMSGPNGYGDAFKEVREYLDPWKEIPGDQQDVLSFKYIYGKEQYLLQRMDDHTQVIFDNEETGEHETYQKSLNMLEDLRILMIVYDLRYNYTYTEEGENVVPWSIEIEYGNGNHYLYQSCDPGFKCGYTHAFEGFFSRWSRDSEIEININDLY